LSGLENLRSLDAWNNPISSIPAELGKLKKLETFSFQPDKLSPQARDWLRTQLGGTLVKPSF
jgi:Leucine-rich repeat (LRR) protein